MVTLSLKSDSVLEGLRGCDNVEHLGKAILGLTETIISVGDTEGNQVPLEHVLYALARWAEAPLPGTAAAKMALVLSWVEYDFPPLMISPAYDALDLRRVVDVLLLSSRQLHLIAASAHFYQDKVSVMGPQRAQDLGAAARTLSTELFPHISAQKGGVATGEDILRFFVDWAATPVHKALDPEQAQKDKIALAKAFVTKMLPLVREEGKEGSLIRLESLGRMMEDVSTRIQRTAEKLTARIPLTHEILERA